MNWATAERLLSDWSATNRNQGHTQLKIPQRLGHVHGVITPDGLLRLQMHGIPYPMNRQKLYRSKPKPRGIPTYHQWEKVDATTTESNIAAYLSLWLQPLHFTIWIAGFLDMLLNLAIRMLWMMQLATGHFCTHPSIYSPRSPRMPANAPVTLSRSQRIWGRPHMWAIHRERLVLNNNQQQLIIVVHICS